MSADVVQAEYFDGQRAQARRVDLRIEAAELLILDSHDGQLVQRHPTRQVQWPERTRHGARIAQLPGGASVQALSSTDWDTWQASHVQTPSWVVQAQLSWLATALALIALLGALWAGYQWGLPWGARAVVAVTPHALDRQLGQVALDSLEGAWFKPSQLPARTQQHLTAAFEQAAKRTALAQALPAWATDTPYRVVFRRSTIGPNALAFPDGTIVITDELVKLLDGQDQVLTGVFAHEWGHLQQRHSMRMLVQASALGALVSFVLGDFSSVLATAPALLGQMGYSRDLEREADDTAIAVMKANRIPTRAMVALFEKLAQARDDNTSSSPGIAFSSHPSDAERIARFSQP